MKRALSGLLLGISLLWSASALASDLIVGRPPDPGRGNCYPFGCAYNGEYQQVYTASLFSEKMEIVGLEVFNTQVNEGATTTNSGTFTISLSTTSTDWDTLSTDFSQNIGPNNTQVFSGSLLKPWDFGDALNIRFQTPFKYNPANGNLLIDVVTSGTSDGNGLIHFDTNGYNNGGLNGNTFFGRVYCSGGTNCVSGNIFVNSGYGLVTGFFVSHKDGSVGSVVIRPKNDGTP